MTIASLPLVTYLWHYLIARLLFDQLVRPLERGDGSGLVLVACVAGVGFLLGRMTARRR